MKNGIVTPAFFDVLDSIRQRHNVGDLEWARASGLKYQSRISELRRIAKEKRLVGKEPRIGRAVSIQKMLRLLDGLITIFGGQMVTKELLRRLDEAQSAEERLFILVALLRNGEIKKAEDYLMTLLRGRPKD